MKITATIFTLALLFSTAAASPSFAATTTVLSDGWRFHHGQQAGAAEPSFDDSGWREIRLPHDWAIEGPFEADADGSTGKLPWKGQAWYRRAFELAAGEDGRRVYFDFDGVMAFPRVYVNGQLAGEWDYGYTSFRVDATPYVKWGERNTIAVHVDTRKWGSRWYPGAGIYRKVGMVIAGPVHIAHWGVQVDGRPAEGAPAVAMTRTTVENHGRDGADILVDHVITDASGNAVATGRLTLQAPSGKAVTGELGIELSDPLLWDIEHPNLYTLTTTLTRSGKVIDTLQTRFGFRSFSFTADDGFHLNGRRVQLYGVNLHHDLGPLGAAFNRRAAQRQLEIMRDMGVNALRTSHNPPAPEVLDLCDEMGIVVWDEVFDKYDWTAGRPDLQPPLPEFSRRHIQATVRRDINHPSVIVWSTGNEVDGNRDAEGVNPERVKMMADFVRDIDRSRPVGMANHIPSLVDGKNFADLDLMGWNYARRYANYRAQYPNRPVIYSESASALSTRGYYDPVFPARKTDYAGTFQVSSYDLNAAAWADIPDLEFQLMQKDAFVAGEFVWTGFDYLGEPTPFPDQARSSYFGIVDLAGFPKDRYYLYRSHWRPDETTVHILPHWNWPNRTGKNVPVFVYTNGDSAELFLNGRSLGMRHKGVRPARAPNLAAEGRATATVSLDGHGPAAATDHNMDTEWRGDTGASWQLDLGAVKPVAQLTVDVPTKENNYAYVIEGSDDGEHWTRLAAQTARLEPRWSGPTRSIHNMQPVPLRHLRITFNQATNLETGESAPVGLKEVMVFGEAVEDDYYDVTYDYRLRWNAVGFEPGELRAVAYKDKQVIGESVVETTGAAARLELVADRGVVSADGEDLVFVTVNALDAQGRQHPLARDEVFFTVTGPGEIAAVANGDPLSFEPFIADRRHLFYGKALVIVRPLAGQGGQIGVKAVATELEAAELVIESRPTLSP